MAETKRAEIPNFTGGEAASITQQGNPYIFRTSFTQVDGDAEGRALPQGQPQGQVGGGDLGQQRLRQGRPRRRSSRRSRRRASRSPPTSRPTRARSTSPAPVLKAKQSNADALFVYTNEEESARALRELRKQGYDKPIVGETTLTGQKVIELAGDAANGAIAHVGLTADAPQPRDQGVRRQVPEGIQVQERPQRHEGLQRACTSSRRSPRRTASSTRKAFAKALHGAKISAKDNPGVLLDVTLRRERRPRPRELPGQGRQRQAGRDRRRCRRARRK